MSPPPPWWRRQIQRQPKTDLTIADFCRQLGVSVPTFYYWKRRVQAGLWTPWEPVAEAAARARRRRRERRRAKALEQSRSP